MHPVQLLINFGGPSGRIIIYFYKSILSWTPVICILPFILFGKSKVIDVSLKSQLDQSQVVKFASEICVISKFQIFWKLFQNLRHCLCNLYVAIYLFLRGTKCATVNSLCKLINHWQFYLCNPN